MHVERESLRAPWLMHINLDAIIESGELDGQAEVFELKDNERALVWVDGRFNRIPGPGLYLPLGFGPMRSRIILAM